MTKCIVIGEQPTEELKPIEFIKFFDKDWGLNSSHTPTNHYYTIELIVRDYGYDRLDLMFAYGSDRNDGTLYLGYWNGGVV